MKHTVRDVMKWIAAIQRDGRGLTAWEEEFIEDCAMKLEQSNGGRNFSQKQIDIIERIYADRTPN